MNGLLHEYLQLLYCIAKIEICPFFPENVKQDLSSFVVIFIFKRTLDILDGLSRSRLVCVKRPISYQICTIISELKLWIIAR